MALKDIFNFDAPPLYLMDASAFIFKGYYGNMKMTRADGFPTGAIYTVARILLKLLKEEQPKYFSFVKDGRGKNFRHEIYPLYKANRDTTPEELVMQFEPIEEMVKAFGLHLEISNNCEADDCIASLAHHYRNERNVVIVGIDKDLKQCLHENVFMWDPSVKGNKASASPSVGSMIVKEGKIVTLDTFREETGLEPSQWADIQAIIGDSSDNIPGVKGIGNVTAQKLFKEYPSLEDIRDNYENLSKTVKAKFEGNLEAMFMYRQLTTLDTKCCEHIKKDDLKLSPLNFEKCMEFFRVYEMPSLQKELYDLKNKGLILLSEEDENSNDTIIENIPSAQSGKRTSNKQSHASMQMSLFDDFSQSSEEITIDSRKTLPEISSIKEKEIAFIQASFVSRNQEGFYVAFDDEEFHYDGNMEEFSRFLNNFESIVCFNYKEILRKYSEVALHANFEKKNVFDLALISYLLNPEQRDYSWGKVSNQFREKTRTIPFEKAGSLLLALKKLFVEEMEKTETLKLYQKLELPLVPVLANMEEEGILLDIKATENFLVEIQNELEKNTKEIYSLAGKEFNIRSAQQTGDILYNHLQLPIASKTKGGQSSTSQETLEKLIGSHPIIDALLEYRKSEKLRSTYLEPLPKLVDNNGRIHTTFNQMATATGRLSSSNPNLQNIPIRGALGQRVRSCFIAEEGRSLISADYSQIELRVLAHYSMESTLLEAFRRDEDIHKSTAALLNSVSLNEVTVEQRQAAKTINFGLLYGMGARKLAQDIKVSQKEAQEFIKRYFERFKGIKAFYDKALQDAQEKGYVTTLVGRRRALPDLFSPSRQAQTLAERQAINTLIQGTAADIIKLAMLLVSDDAELKSYDAKLLLQVHDELIISVPQENAEKAGERLSSLMSSIKVNDTTEFAVPLKVEYASAQNWLQAH